MRNSILAFLVLSIFLISSCSKDANNDDKFDEIELREGKLMNKKECFEFVFPIEVIAPDGTMISSENEDEFYTQIKKWYKSNPDTKEKPGLSYPVDILFKGEKLITIANEVEMIKTKDFCGDKEGFDKEDCFDIVFPIGFTMPDGSSITVENEVDMWAAIKDWYEDHPDVKDKPITVYPIDIIFNEDKTVTVSNDEEMTKHKKDCK